MNKKWVTIGVLGVLVLGGGYWGYKHFTAKPAVATNITAKAKMGTVSKVITATGTVNFPHSIPLTFKQAGQIQAFNVKVGDAVKAGQVLAKTDDSSLQLAVTTQQAAVTSAQAKLETLKESFNTQTLSSAQSAVAQAEQGVATAQQALTTAQQNAEPNYLANQVSLAKAAVQQASNDYAKAQQTGSASSTALNQALTALTTAQNAQNGGAAQALASAQAQTRSAQAGLTSAQAQLDLQKQGPKSGDIASAEADINTAQVQLASAQKDLANAEIIAPVDAVIVSAPLQLGQQSDATSIITITPAASNLEVAASIAQSDIAQVKVGQKVDITLDSNPDKHISGTVSLVALQGTIVSNVTTYTVTVTIDQANDLLRAGMNANVSIIVDEVKNVLTVPSEAVKTIRNRTGVMVPLTSSTSTGQATTAGQTTTQPNSAGSAGAANAGSGNAGAANAGTAKASATSAAATSKFIPVVIGLDDGTNVEIKSGLTEGQEVIIGTRSSTTATKATSGSLLGGGGGANPARALSGGGGGGGPRGN
ncbi:MAG: HlyD family efflux transporter periplasmic adaptor subunit [Desulfosporosinus sp.]|nr:HlyD family efflux transporter periplasmic adaptor subunit [Desulfosporosinus sp.]